MKNLFGVFKNSVSNNFEKFVIRKTGDESNEKLDKVSNAGKRLRNRRALMGWISFASAWAIVIGLLFVVAMFLAKDGFASALQTRGYVFYLGLGFSLMGLIVTVIVRVKAKKVSPIQKTYNRKIDKAIAECELELGVPNTAASIDVLFARMKRNNKGEERLIQMSSTTYINQELSVFVENDLLCFVYSREVIGVPLDSIKGIKTIKKMIGLPRWNKDEPIDGPVYATYKLHTNQTNYIWCKSYYEIDLDIDGESYYFSIPCYEKESLIKILGKEIPEIQ